VTEVSELIQTSSRLITYSAAKTDNQAILAQGGPFPPMTFSCCKLFFCHDSLENVAGIDALSSFLTSCKTKNI